ncbi:MAG: hypothetical protein AAFU53_03995 [Cyanobacteria bacterium J06632_3]
MTTNVAVVADSRADSQASYCALKASYCALKASYCALVEGQQDNRPTIALSLENLFETVGAAK